LNKKLALSLIALSVIFSGCSSDKEVKKQPAKHISKLTPKKSAPSFASSFTGSPISKKEVNRFFSVMIENSPEARPQTGLSDADLVYEIRTEGSITRYLAFFHDSIPEKIGPVRSARHYFIPLAEERNIPYIHFGASIYAYEHLQNYLKVPAIDGIATESQYFMRDKSRSAPHNAYLIPSKLPDFKSKLSGTPYSFGKLEKGNFDVAEGVSISFNSFTDVSYIYNKDTKRYMRMQEGTPHIDAGNGKQIATDNVILRYAKHTSLSDEKNRIDVTLDGSGEATLLRNGKKITGTWEKINGEITFYTKDGNKMMLKPGKTWIEVVDTSLSVSFN